MIITWLISTHPHPVDAGEAGEGNLEILVVSSIDQQNVPTRVEAMPGQEGQARFRVSFVPRVPGNHSVIVTFNDETVMGKIMRISNY